MRLLVCALTCLLLQAAQPRPAALQGHVVRAGTSQPVAHARIVAAKVGGPHTDYRVAVADEKGRFSIPEIAAGTYRVYATRDGYLRAEFGRRGAGASGVPIALAEGQTSPDLALAMTPTGAIAGRVFEHGRPVRSAWVRAFKPRYFDGERGLTLADWAQTDDRGEYRLFGLTPGAYFVTAIPRDRPRIEGDALIEAAMPTIANGNRSEIRTPLSLATLTASAFGSGVYPVLFYPSVSDASAATAVEVRAGETTPAIDFLVATVPTFHVRGRVALDPAIAADTPITVRISRTDGTFVRVAPEVAVRAGTFDLAGVQPGRYSLSAYTSERGSQTHASTRVEVADRDVDGIVITMRHGVTVTGRVSIDGGGPIPTDAPISVQLQGGDGMPGYSAMRVQPDGSFSIENVAPREYRFRIFQPRRTPWIKSARYGEADVLAGPLRIDADPQGRQLDIVVGTTAATVDALVEDDSHHPVAGVLVIAVPDGARRQQSQAYRSATTGADGHARIEGLAPGGYTLFASDSIEAGDWQDPAVLQRQESRGTAVTVKEGETRQITLRITS